MEAYSPPTSRRSAGTMTPSLILTMSPGTSVAAASVCHLPSRITVASGASPFLNAASALEALRSCQNSSPALKNNSAAMMAKSSQCPMIADTSAAASIIGVRPGEVPHDLAEQADLFFNERVGAILGEPLARLGAAQSLLGLDGKLGKDLVDRQLLEVGRGVRPSLVRARGGLQGNGGHGLLLGTRSRD